ncbi:hypothetical protein [Candidatus Entotheonella palauensis]|uniref:hypothetical protein n=1 Tax=Candidatus Entotheonella palauensis TaxID=93172 RepID=UPI000B7E2C36|nr:hypothetical protein [Candidatus Entotheonella palauensis]
MSRLIILDAGPLGLVTQRRGVAKAEACRTWLAECLRHGAQVIVPAIAYYEVRRELERIPNSRGLERLEAFCQATPERYVPLSDTALRRGCRLWAQARNAGRPTADPSALDCDVLLAAQALTYEGTTEERIIATTNVGHLPQFMAAAHWRDIVP